jgi:hypothetical protein
MCFLFAVRALLAIHLGLVRLFLGRDCCRLVNFSYLVRFPFRICRFLVRHLNGLGCPIGGYLPLLFTWLRSAGSGEGAKPVPPDVVCWSGVYLSPVLKQCPTLAPTFYRARVPSLRSALCALALSKAGAGSFGT